MKRFAVVLIAIMVCILLVTGCSTPSTSPTQTQVPVAPSQSTPKYGGILRIIGNPISPDIGWPPENAKQVGGAAPVNQYCLETLLRGDIQGKLQPWLAESYKIADDLKSITFKLNKDIKFHDGSDFNAEVVKWNYDNMIATNIEPYRHWASVDVLDDYTVRVNFTEWQSILPLSFAEGTPSAI